MDLARARARARDFTAIVLNLSPSLSIDPQRAATATRGGISSNREARVNFVMSGDSAASHSVGLKGNVFSGWLFLIFGSFSFLVFLFSAIISKLLPPSGNQIISAIQNDRYYCFLVPLTLPVLVVAVYFHWLSMKLFKHA